MKITLEQLKDLGFAHCDEWRLDDAAQPVWDGNAPDRPGLYLFAVGSDVRYVGAAVRGLRRRLQSYQRR